MVIYKCHKCNKTFNHFGNFNTHLLRLFPCSPKNIETTPISTQPYPTPDELSCQFCKKTFSRKDICKRHEKYNCKDKKNIEIEQKKKEILDELKKTKQTIINFQTVNNFQQNIQNNIQQNFNYPIHPFGKEDISFLSNSLMKTIFSNPDQGIPKLIRLIHFNPEIPQNHNVRLKNKKEPYLDVFNGHKWELRDKDDTIQDLITSKKELADDYFENLLTQQDESIIQKQDNIINALTQKKYQTYTEAIDDYLNTIILDNDQSKKVIMNKYKRLYDKLYKQINLILLNNSQLASHLNEIKNLKEP